jgi:hypothetical protein
MLNLLDGRLPTAIAGADPQGEVYRHLVLAVCRFYHATLPFLFEQLNDETELLLPDDLLTATSLPLTNPKSFLFRTSG